MYGTTFEWPTPPYFGFAQDSGKTDPESCLLYLRNGKKILGTLTCFVPEESSLEFMPSRRETSETISFDEIKSMRLVKPLQLNKHPPSLESRTDEVYPASERQPYTIEFHDKETMQGETISFANTTYGLYLFLPSAKEKIIRCFIPQQAIVQYQIGLRIGEILVDEKLASQEDVDEALSQQQRLRTQRIGDYLSEHQIISSEQLRAAIQYQEGKPILKLGEALRQLGLITEAQLHEALATQKKNRSVQLGQILLNMEIIDERTLKGVLAKKMGIPYVGLTKFNFDAEAIKAVAESVARKHMLMPLYMNETCLVVALENPLDITALDYLRFLTQKKIVPAMASREDIEAALDTYYTNQGYAFELPAPVESKNEYLLHQAAAPIAKSGRPGSKALEKEMDTEAAEQPADSDNAVVQLVNDIIMQAHAQHASDIHIENSPGKHNARVRFRKDGALSHHTEIHASIRNTVISRIKIMANLDISERRKPQDGKINFQHFGPAKIELRVATIPTSNNMEDVVMRLLASSKPIPMDKLGLAPTMLVDLQKLMQRPYGLILVCGPTGSGKTTTLHSLLGHINSPERKIWTAEDPIEITQQGLRQVQINSKIGWTFAAAMRSFLRADPDVIMVGEMRDEETAQIAMQASLTGHLVLSTLHTNSAAESIVRLLDLGMDPFNFADALQAILAQRLVKSLCPKCKQAYEAQDDEIEALVAEYTHGSRLDPAAVLEQWKTQYAHKGKFRLNRATGCEHCGGNGYRGRLGLHELMITTPVIKHLVQTRALVSEILEAAIDAGMRTLKQDGIAKVLQGHTDMMQVRAASF
jgi:type II secretory ATPase GspE/PulE/Tfp pilus assembly ATPase PilB-like protein